MMKIIAAFLKRLSKREKSILYAAGFFIFLTLSDRMVISPIFSRISTLNNEIQETEATIKRNLQIVAHKDRILSESAKYSDFIKSFQSEEEEITSLLKEVENLASKSSIYLVDMKPRGLKEIGTSLKYLIKLTCEAQMEQIVDFMYNIENSKKLLTIEQYEISPKSKASSVAICSISISKLVVPEKLEGEQK